MTSGGIPSDLAGGTLGNVFRYTITILNTGNLDLSLVTLTDDQAPVGGTVKNVTDDTTTTWLAGEGGIATLNIGDLASGAVLSYSPMTTPAQQPTSARLKPIPPLLKEP